MRLSYLNLFCYLSLMMPCHWHADSFPLPHLRSCRPLHLWLNTSLHPWIKGRLISHPIFLRIILGICIFVGIIINSFSLTLRVGLVWKTNCTVPLVRGYLKTGITIISRLWAYNQEGRKVFSCLSMAHLLRANFLAKEPINNKFHFVSEMILKFIKK